MSLWVDNTVHMSIKEAEDQIQCYKEQIKTLRKLIRKAKAKKRGR